MLRLRHIFIMAEADRAVFQNPNWLSYDEILAMGVPDLYKEPYRRYAYQQAFGLNTCFDAIGPHTFATEFLPLTANEVETIVLNFCPVFKKCTDEDARRKVRDDPMLTALAKRVDEKIAKLGNGAVFIKLNTRSPKDVIFDDFNEAHVRRVFESMRADLIDIRNEQSKELQSTLANIDIDETSLPATPIPTPSSTDLVLASLNRTMLRLLRLTTGEAAIALLLRSRRVHDDLDRVRQFAQYDARVVADPSPETSQDKHPNLTVSLVIRAWSDTVLRDTQLEHRAFVYKGIMTSLTQYDNMTYDARIARAHEEIPKRVLGFWEQELRDKLARHESYVVDFLVSTDGIKVIEINPFHNGAGACLFSWASDRQQLMGETFEYRYVKEPAKADILDSFPVVWAKELKKLMEGDERVERRGSSVFGRVKAVVSRWF